MKLRESASQDPRSRLATVGAAALSDVELVGALVGSAEIATVLIGRFGSLETLARATLGDLIAQPGVGPAVAARVLAAVQFSARLSRRRAASVRLDEASRIADLLGPEMRLLPQETARVVLLDTQLRLIGVEEVSRGLLDQTLVAAREVFYPAISRRAYGLILAHNHPSGNPTPSESDIRITRALREAAKVLDIPLIDHVVIGVPSTSCPEGWFSFKAAGYL